jgi:two-component system NtrC family response regulator
MLLGRGKECDIVVPDSTISRAHCKFQFFEDSITVTDLDSANGIHLNGEKIIETDLQLGDQLVVGAIPFLLVNGNDPNEAEHGPSETDSIYVSETDSFLLHERLDTSEFLGNPDTVLDLSSIGWLARELSQAKTRDELTKVLVRRIRRRLSPYAIHLVDFRPEEPYEQKLFCKRGYDCFTNEKRMEYAFPMRGTKSDPSGQSVYIYNTNQKIQLATVPIIFSGEVIAVLAVELAAESLNDDERYLDFLLAAATTFAPFLQANEKLQSLREQNRSIAQSGNKTIFVGESAQVCVLLEQVKQAADTDLNVLISGETGVGKELIARLLHENSACSKGPFVAVNCAAMPTELFSSEIFGHEKGAFSGAHESRRGFAESASGGTLFLDEVGDLTAQNQAALLRFIETRTFFSVGGRKEIQTDSRVIAATNKNLLALVGSGDFRLDLYHRLSAVSLLVPPLRERREDIPIIAELFYDQALKYAKRPLLGLTEDGFQYLQRLDWPGNARELKNVIDRAVAFATDERITQDDLTELVSDDRSKDVAVLFESTPTLEELEKNYIEQVYFSCGGNGVKASKVLGIPKSTMYDKLAYYGISAPRSKKN